MPPKKPATKKASAKTVSAPLKRHSILSELFQAEPETDDIDFEIRAKQRLFERAVASASASAKTSASVKGNTLAALTAAAAATVNHKTNSLTTILTPEPPLPADLSYFSGGGAIEETLDSLRDVVLGANNNNNNNNNNTRPASSSRVAQEPQPKKSTKYAGGEGSAPNESSSSNNNNRQSNTNNLATSASVRPFSAQSLQLSTSSSKLLKGLLGDLNKAAPPPPPEGLSFLSSMNEREHNTVIGDSSSSSMKTNTHTSTSSVSNASSSKASSNVFLTEAEMIVMRRSAEALPAIAHALFLYANLYWAQNGGGSTVGGGVANLNANVGDSTSAPAPINPPATTNTTHTCTLLRSVPIDEKLLLAVSPRCPVHLTRDHIEYVCQAYPNIFNAKWTTVVDMMVRTSTSTLRKSTPSSTSSVRGSSASLAHTPRLFINVDYDYLTTDNSSSSSSLKGANSSEASSTGAGTQTADCVTKREAVPTIAWLRGDLLKRYGNDIDEIARRVVAAHSHSGAVRKAQSLRQSPTTIGGEEQEQQEGESRSEPAGGGLSAVNALATRSMKAALAFANTSFTEASAAIITSFVGANQSSSDKQTLSSKEELGKNQKRPREENDEKGGNEVGENEKRKGGHHHRDPLLPLATEASVAVPKRRTISFIIDGEDGKASSAPVESRKALPATTITKVDVVDKSGTTAPTPAPSLPLPAGVSRELYQVLSEEKKRQLSSAMAVEDLFKNHQLSAILHRKVENERLLVCFDLIASLFAVPIVSGLAQGLLGTPTTTTKNYMYGFALIQLVTQQNATQDSEETVRRQIAKLIKFENKGSGLSLVVDPCLGLIEQSSAASQTTAKGQEGDSRGHTSDNTRLLVGEGQIVTIVNGISLDSGIVVFTRSKVDRRALAAATSEEE